MTRALPLILLVATGCVVVDNFPPMDMSVVDSAGGQADLASEPTDGGATFRIAGVVGTTQALPPDISLVANQGGNLTVAATTPLDAQRRFVFTSVDESVLSAHADAIPLRFAVTEPGVSCSMTPTLSAPTTRVALVGFALRSSGTLRNASWGDAAPPWTTAWSMMWADGAVRVTGRLTCSGGSRPIDYEYDWTLTRGINWIQDSGNRSQTVAAPAQIWVNPPP